MKDLKKLADKFPEQDLEWRVQQAGTGKGGAPWALIIPYVTNRAIMQRLDDVCGPGNWKNEYKASPCGTGYMCGISIKIDDEWVTRWDGAEFSGKEIDQVKTTSSNSMKRAGVQWGIGRYLYLLDAEFADCVACDNRSKAPPGYTFQFSKGNQKKNQAAFGFAWKPKPLAQWLLPVTEDRILEHLNAFEMASNLEQLKKAFKYAWNLAVSEQDDKLKERFESAKSLNKERIEHEAQKAIERQNDEAKRFIKKQIDIIKTAPNESVVQANRDLALSQIKNIIGEDTQSKALDMVNDAAVKTIELIRGKHAS